MKRLFAILLWLSILFQNVAPAVVLAQEIAQEQEVVSAAEPSPTPEAGPEPEQTEPTPSPAPIENIEQASPEPSTEVSPSPSDSATPLPSPSPSPVEQSPDEAEIPNEATDSAELKSASAVGGPSASSQPSSNQNSGSESGSSSEMSTGDSAAVSQTTNAANNQVVNSNVSLVTENLSGDQDADLNDLWCEEPTPQQSASPEPQVASDSAALHDSLLVDNEATVSNSLDVAADTGNNTVDTDGDATVLTGDAIAIANLINLLNSTFIDSQLMIAMLNVWPNFSGDIILPRPELVMGADQWGEDGGSLQFSAEQWAQILNELQIQATTGNNTASASGQFNEMSTGNAYAAANLSNFANLLLQKQGKYGLWVNVAAGWNGSIYGADDQQMSLAPGLYFFNFGSMLGYQETCGELGASPCLPENIGLNNSADLYNKLNVSANTGGNTIDADGNSVLHTGNATAIANVFNMVNSTFIQSQMFFGFVNILGDWTGNIWLAYPDVGVTLSADKEAVQLGDTVTYTVNYKNGGKDAADDVTIDFALPAGTEYLSDSLNAGLGNFSVGTLQPGQTGSFQIVVKVSDWNMLSAQAREAGFLSHIIRPAYADSEQKSITATARIITSEPQSSTRNDQAMYRTAVYREIEDLSGVGGVMNENQELGFYDITLNMEHNVGEYVFPGDVVTFTARIRNDNDTTLEKVTLMHQIVDEDGNVLAEVAFPIGTMNAYKGGLVSFGMQIPQGQLLSSVRLSTRSWVTGTSIDGSAAESGVSTSQFTVRPKAFQLPLTTTIPVVPAGAEASNGEVLGAAVSSASATGNEGMALWQALAILLFVFLTVRMLRRLEAQQTLLAELHT